MTQNVFGGIAIDAVLGIMCCLYFTGYAFTVASAFPVLHSQHARTSQTFETLPRLPFSIASSERILEWTPHPTRRLPTRRAWAYLIGS